MCANVQAKTRAVKEVREAIREAANGTPPESRVPQSRRLGVYCWEQGRLGEGWALLLSGVTSWGGITSEG